jgi:hypothetical protein
VTGATVSNVPAVAFAAFAIAALSSGSGIAARSNLTADGTEFVLITGDGRVLRSADLVGATLRIGGEHGISIRIESVEKDPQSIGGDIFLYRFVVEDDRHEVFDFCTPDAEGRRLGFPVPDGKGGLVLTCTSGALGKCVRWGYRFWEEKLGGPPLDALHQACIRMVRADYGGDGSANTRDGTLITFCDRFGINPCEGGGADMSFEAAWAPDGAVCVARPRIAEIISLEQLREHYPRLEGRLGSVACSEKSAMQNGAAILFNRSQE